MGISVSGVTPAATAVVQSPVAHTAKASKGDAPLDFGPAVSFTPSTFDQAVLIQMYNSSGASVALTQWARTGTLPPPESITPTEM